MSVTMLKGRSPKCLGGGPVGHSHAMTPQKYLSAGEELSGTEWAHYEGDPDLFPGGLKTKAHQTSQMPAKGFTKSYG